RTSPRSGKPMRFGISKAVLGIPTPGRAARFDPIPTRRAMRRLQPSCDVRSPTPSPGVASDAARRTDVAQKPRAGRREGRLADMTSVLDEQVREQCALLSRHQLHQIELDLVRVLVRSQAQELG